MHLLIGIFFPQIFPCWFLPSIQVSAQMWLPQWGLLVIRSKAPSTQSLFSAIPINLLSSHLSLSADILFGYFCSVCHCQNISSMKKRALSVLLFVDMRKAPWYKCVLMNEWMNEICLREPFILTNIYGVTTLKRTILSLLSSQDTQGRQQKWKLHVGRGA